MIPIIKKPKMILYVIGGIVGLYFTWRIVKRITTKKAVMEQKQEKKAKQAEKKNIVNTISEYDVFDPDYWKTIRNAKVYDAKQLAKKVLDIRDGIMRKSITRVMAVINSATHKTQISQICFGYNYVFKKDLKTTLIKTFNKKNLQKIYDTVKKLS